MVESHDWQYMTKTWRYTEKHLLPVFDVHILTACVKHIDEEVHL